MLENIKILESYISSNYEEILDNCKIIDEEDIFDDNIGDVKNGKLMKERSPFGKHFVRISEQCELKIYTSMHQ